MLSISACFGDPHQPASHPLTAAGALIRVGGLAGRAEGAEVEGATRGAHAVGAGQAQRTAKAGEACVADAGRPEGGGAVCRGRGEDALVAAAWGVTIAGGL